MGTHDTAPEVQATGGEVQPPEANGSLQSVMLDSSRMSRAALSFLFALLFALLTGRPVAAQNVDLDALITFYGDNTEYSNEFREGETTLGSWIRPESCGNWLPDVTSLLNG